MMKSRLFAKTLLFIALLFGVVTNVMSLVAGHATRTVLTEEYESKAIAIARNLAQSDLISIVDNDAASVQSRIDNYLDLEGVAYVMVTTQEGSLLAHTFIPIVPKQVVDFAAKVTALPALEDTPATEELVLGDAQPILHVAMPVLAGAGGFVHVGMDRAVIDEHISSVVLRQQGIAFTLFCLCVLVVYALMRSVSTPLVALRDYANKVADHDFSGELHITTRDEIGELAGAMSSMSADLHDMVTNLEDAVAEKTAELQDSVSYISAIMANITDGLLVLDDKGRVVRFNTSFERMMGFFPGKVVGRNADEVFNSKGENEDFLARLNDGDASAQTIELILYRFDGALFPVEMALTRITYHGALSIICLFRDITLRRRSEEELLQARDFLEQKVAERTSELSRANAQLLLENAERRVVEQALRRTEERYRSIFENAAEGIFQSTPDGRLIDGNPAIARILGYNSPDELLATVSHVGKQLYVDSTQRSVFVENLEKNDEVSNFEIQVSRKDNEIIWVTITARRVEGPNGRTLYYEGFMEDVTQRRETQEKLEHQAYHDPLTDLPNRLLFQDHLQLAITRNQRRGSYEFAVLYLDLDRFKVINDSLGHDVGDELLRHVSRELLICVRDLDTVARFGGDEFAILLEDIEAARDAVRIARRIQVALTAPVVIQGHEVFTSASIGIVLKTDRYFSPDEVLRDADTAMYRAKEMGKARFKVFNQRMHDQALRQMALETDLRRSVEREELEVYYQPIMNLHSEQVVGFEALVRWTHPTLGPISPAEFIPLAEDSGLIGDIGHQVLIDAVQRATTWNDQALFPHITHDMFVSVNISGRQFMQPYLAVEIEELVTASGVNPDLLRFEITESVLMEQGSFAVECVNKLRKLGIRMCIDDFGTGYSSLSYLQRMPMDTIKIDRAFVKQMLVEEGGISIVRSVLSLGESLGMDVVAEGVETAEQAELLQKLGCKYVQGFLYARPMPVDQVEELLAAKHAFGSEQSGDDFLDASGL